MTTNNAVNVGLSGSTGTGSFVGSNGATIIIPNIQGVTDGSVAAPGDVGEVISITVPFASAVSIFNNSPTDLTSITLTAGDWDVYANLAYNASIGIPTAFAWLNTASATPVDSSMRSGLEMVTDKFTFFEFTIPMMVLNVNTSTNVYLTGLISIASGTCTMCGGIIARRRR